MLHALKARGVFAAGACTGELWPCLSGEDAGGLGRVEVRAIPDESILGIRCCAAQPFFRKAKVTLESRPRHGATMMRFRQPSPLILAGRVAPNSGGVLAIAREQLVAAHSGEQ